MPCLFGPAWRRDRGAGPRGGRLRAEHELGREDLGRAIQQIGWIVRELSTPVALGYGAARERDAGGGRCHNFLPACAVREVAVAVLHAMPSLARGRGEARAIHEPELHGGQAARALREEDVARG